MSGMGRWYTTDTGGLGGGGHHVLWIFFLDFEMVDHVTQLFVPQNDLQKKKFALSICTLRSELKGTL